MTQKKSEIPQELFVKNDQVYVACDYDDHFYIADKTSFAPEEDTRYILAAPKEDVERALDEFPEIDASFWKYGSSHVVRSFDQVQYQTIRRVLLANAGRKE